MTRLPIIVVIVALTMPALPPNALALAATDTMAAWKDASSAEKSRVVEEILRRDGRGGDAAAVVRCLDAASGVAGHDALPIDKLVQACAKETGEPV